jgi:hypothetical protein
MKQLALVFALALVACGGPQIKAAYKTDVDTTLSSQRGDQRALGRAALEPMPWKVGQWAMYKTIDKGKPGYEKYSIVAQDDCGIWLEHVAQDYYRRSITKVCYSRMPWMPDGNGNYVAQIMDLVEVMISQGDTGQPQVWDFRQNPQMRESIKMMVSTMIDFDWRGKEALAREDVNVPAGSFSGAATWAVSATILWKTVTVNMRIHAEVPIYGIVRSQSSEGRVSELVDYGESGAVTALATPTASAR